MHPFTVRWSDDELDRVIGRVADTRLPPALPGVGWSLGCDAAFLAKLQSYWVNDYDLNATHAKLNRYPQFITTIDGQDIHFVHVKAEIENARPMIMTHGWPGSHIEFWNVIDALTHPSRHGGKAADAFELVIPSLPGFGFSGKPSRAIGPRETARLWNTLMTQRLHFPHYLAHGGDWGSLVTTWMGADYAASVSAIHLSMLCLLQPDPPANEEEERWLHVSREKQKALNGYVALQTRKPQSIAWAAADNPLGQAAWIVERFHDWSDLHGRELDEVFDMDHLITNAMIYVMTESFASGAWYYHAMAGELAAQSEKYPRCRVPTAFAAFPGDPMTPIPPRSRADPIYNISRWSEQPRGGHFPALQEPRLVIEDIWRWSQQLAK